MGHCKDCIWWDSWDGVCDAVHDYSEPVNHEEAFFLHDRHPGQANLHVDLKTGPMFGCILFTD